MKKIFLIFILIPAILAGSNELGISPEEQTIIIKKSETIFYYDLEPEVKVERINPYAKTSLSRNVIVITSEDIENSGYKNVDEILNNLACIGIQSRQRGIQSDVTIRGSNFEDVLIMLDGIVLNNPQTGHHNLNIPVSISEIERIEVMPGPSSSLYGSYGYAGTVNIITKKNFLKDFQTKVSYGNYNTYNVSTLFSYPLQKFLFNFGFDKTKSDGFTYGREYDLINFNTSILYSLNKDEKLELYYGIVKRDFGAYDFYTPGKNLASKENIQNQLAYLNLNKNLSFTYLEFKIFYNYAYDEFILKREVPDFYHNEHWVTKYGAQTLLSFKFTKFLFYSFLLSLNDEKIDSTKLGKHERKSFGIGNEFIIELNRIGGNVSSRIDLYERGENYFNFNTGIYYWISKFLKIRTSAGTSYRMPSFTELYYKDPYNFGNNNLKASKNLSYEAGADFYFKNFQFRNTIFARLEKNFIDWVGKTETGPWYAENVDDKMIFYGMENELALNLFEKIKLTARHSFVDIKDGKDYISKYGLNYSKNQFSISLYTPLMLKIESFINAVYKIRKDVDWIVVNFGIKRTLYKDSYLFFNIDNLFNEDYEEISGIKESPQQITAGINIKM